MKKYICTVEKRALEGYRSDHIQHLRKTQGEGFNNCTVKAFKERPTVKQNILAPEEAIRKHTPNKAETGSNRALSLFLLSH